MESTSNVQMNNRMWLNVINAQLASRWEMFSNYQTVEPHSWLCFRQLFIANPSIFPHPRGWDGAPSLVWSMKLDKLCWRQGNGFFPPNVNYLLSRYFHLALPTMFLVCSKEVGLSSIKNVKEHAEASLSVSSTDHSPWLTEGQKVKACILSAIPSIFCQHSQFHNSSCDPKQVHLVRWHK